jgi:hypothetical protein
LGVQDAKMEILEIDQTFSLRIETRAEQLRFLLDRVQSMLDEHPAIEPGTSRIRVNDFAGAHKVDLRIRSRRGRRRKDQ